MRKVLLSSLLLLALPVAAFAQTATPTPAPISPTATAEVTVEAAATTEAAATSEVGSGDAGTNPIEFGQSLDGELTAEMPEVYYTFSADADTAVSITLTSEDFDTYLVLEDSEGNVLDTDDDSAGNLDSRISAFSVPAAGDYTIRATSYAAYNGSSSPAVGAYTISIETIEIDVIEYGETVDGELTEDAPSATYVFRGSEGDSVVITETSSDFDSYLHLSDPSGYELVTNDDGAGNLNSRIGPYLLPADGNYSIVATSLSGSGVGSFTLSLDRVESQPIEIDEPATVELNGGPSYLTFEAQAGDVINVEVDSDIDTNLALMDPYNYTLITDEDSGSGTNPELTSYLLSSAGTYMLVIDTPFSDTGTAEVSLTRAELPSLDEGSIELTFSSSVQQRPISFTGEAGSTVRLTVVSTNGSTISPNLDVQQNGVSLGYGSSSYVQEMSIVFTVPDDGSVNVTVGEYSYSNAAVEVTLSSAE